MDVKGMAYSVAAYRVIDLYERLDSAERPIHAELPHFQLDIQLGEMSDDERREAAAALSSALERLSSDGK